MQPRPREQILVIIISMLYGLAIVTIGYLSYMNLIQIVHATYPIALSYLPPFTLADIWVYQRDGMVGAAVFGAALGLYVAFLATARHVYRNVDAHCNRLSVPAIGAESEGRQVSNLTKMLHEIVPIICLSVILPVGSLIMTAWSGGEKDAVASNLWLTASVNVLGVAWCLVGGLMLNKVRAHSAENEAVTDAKREKVALSTMV